MRTPTEQARIEAQAAYADWIGMLRLLNEIDPLHDQVERDEAIRILRKAFEGERDNKPPKGLPR